MTVFSMPSPEHVVGYRRLWVMVLMQAMRDAVGVALVSHNREAVMAGARHWLTRPSRDLAEICALAGIEMEQVLATSRALSAQGWPRDVFNDAREARRRWNRQTDAAEVEARAA